MDTSDNFSAERRYQRRPNLAAALSIPAPLLRRVQICAQTLRQGGGEPSVALSELLLKLTAASTAEAQLRVISQMIGKMAEWGSPLDQDTLCALAGNFAFPWLLDCRVRYAHKSLIGMAKTYFCSEGSPVLTCLEDAFAEAHLKHVWPSHPSKDMVLHFVNSLDAITVTTAPVFHSTFAIHFFATLPILAQSLNWSLDNALNNRKKSQNNVILSAVAGSNTAEEEEAAVITPGAEGGSAGSVFGEDLDLIRFCVRVVATHVHKFLYTVSARLEADEGETCTAASNLPAWDATAQHGLVGVLLAALRMLSSNILPKDVLNAAGLLVASIATLRGPNIGMLETLCRSACDERPSATSVSEENDTCSVTRGNCVEIIAALCDNEIPRVVAALTSCGRCLTHNGRFALFKGLLSHVSSAVPHPAEPVASLPPCGFVADALLREVNSRSIVHHVIVVNAESLTSEVEEPDTRFMAIQTLDAVARHITAVFEAGASIVESWTRFLALHDGPSTEAALTLAAAHGAVQGLTHIAALRHVTPALRHTIDTITRVIMRLWDDPTQQVSGPLYDTYSVVFSINDAMSKLIENVHSLAPLMQAATSEVWCSLGNQLAAEDQLGASSQSPSASLLVSPRQALLSILGTQNDRRGKYHALLAIIHAPMFRREAFLEALESHYKQGSPQASLTRFTTMLIAGSCNSKICSVCGEVLAAVSKKLFAASAVEEASFAKSACDDASTLLWRHAFVDPIAAGACGGAAHFRGLNISATQATSCVLAHMLAPLLKRWPSRTLSDTLSSIASLYAASKSSSSHVSTTVTHTAMIQSVVETLSRARSSNLDISAFVSPSNGTILGVVCEALQCYEFEIRNTAFGLITVSLKGSEPVASWQCRVVERYLQLNLHQGGDSTARNALLQGFKKWMTRLMDSVTSSKARTGIAASENSFSKKQKKLSAAGGDTPTPTDLQRRYEDYVFTIVEHATRVLQLARAHSGIPVDHAGSVNESPLQDVSGAAALQSLSLERRFTALSMWKVVVDLMVPHFLGTKWSLPQNQVSSAAIEQALQRRDISPLHLLELILPSRGSNAAVGSLLATLSEGWDKIRDVATHLLEAYTKWQPTALYQHPLLQVTWELTSPKFRITEGAVSRKRLCVKNMENSAKEARKLLQEVMAKLRSRCHEMQNARSVKDMYEMMKSEPLHGSVSWMGCLHELALADGRETEGISNEVLHMPPGAAGVHGVGVWERCGA